MISLIFILLNCYDLLISPTSHGIRGCPRPSILVTKLLSKDNTTMTMLTTTTKTRTTTIAMAMEKTETMRRATTVTATMMKTTTTMTNDYDN